MSAKYILRFDDVCPTMNWAIWDRIEEAVTSAGISPIVSVIPDNRDPALRIFPARSDFWARVREWRSNGWTIGMHGYQHRLQRGPRGLVGRLPLSEFAGRSKDEQLDMMIAALACMNAHGIEPEIWVAPANSFDEMTLDALSEVGIDKISDGMALWPYRDDRGFLWVPQQQTRAVRVPSGVWTLALHPNRWDLTAFDRFVEMMRRHSDEFLTTQVVERNFGERSLPSWERMLGRCALTIARLKAVGRL